MHLCTLHIDAQVVLMQANHYDRTRQQQIDIGLLAPEQAQASAEQVLSVLCYPKAGSFKTKADAQHENSGLQA